MFYYFLSAIYLLSIPLLYAGLKDGSDDEVIHKRLDAYKKKQDTTLDDQFNELLRKAERFKFTDDISTELMERIKPERGYDAQHHLNLRLGMKDHEGSQYFGKKFDCTQEVKIFTELEGLPGQKEELSWKYHSVSDNPRAIIINYYGGENSSTIGGFLGVSQYIRNPKATWALDFEFFNNHMNVFSIATDDANHKIYQASQFKSGGEGEKILAHTIDTFIKFVHAVKIKFPNTPIFYYGASFGATKGMLINLILSNLPKNKPDATEYKDFFNKGFGYFIKYFDDRTLDEVYDKNLFSGFILHDGQYYTALNSTGPIQTIGHHFWAKVFASRYLDEIVSRYHSTIPVLFVHNFDDERATVDQSLFLYSRLIRDRTDRNNVHFFLTPQAAESVVQNDSVAKRLYGSTSGHFVPGQKDYYNNYWGRIINFIDQYSDGKDNKGNIASEMRYEHTQKLFSGTDSFDENWSSIRAQLYRLYHARLHKYNKLYFNEESHKFNKNELKQIDRIFNTFVEYAIFKARNDTSKAMKIFKDIIRKNGKWLIQSVDRRREQLFLTLRGKNLVKKIRSQPQNWRIIAAFSKVGVNILANDIPGLLTAGLTEENANAIAILRKAGVYIFANEISGLLTAGLTEGKANSIAGPIAILRKAGVYIFANEIPGLLTAALTEDKANAIAGPIGILMKSGVNILVSHIGDLLTAGLTEDNANAIAGPIATLIDKDIHVSGLDIPRLLTAGLTEEKEILSHLMKRAR